MIHSACSVAKRNLEKLLSGTNVMAKRILLFVLAFGFLSATAVAQTANTGALAGIITDASRASVTGAQITATSAASGEARTVSSGPNGYYIVPLLNPGLYAVQVTKSGFKTVNIPQVRITVAETNTLNITVEVGAVSERVTVEAQTEQLQTESSSLGRLTSAEQISTLPLVTRNYLQIIGLNPGVSTEVTDSGAIGRGSLGLGIVSNGDTTSDNNFQMNGVSINDLQQSGQFSGGVAIPNPDTIQEFRVQTSQYDASYGHNAGANVDLVTKGGTNEYHGAAWEYFRNDDLNANTFFRNANNQPRPVLKQNQFGFDLGGPIKKDKLQFFTSYQGTRQRNGIDPNCSSSISEPPLTNDRSALAIATLFNGQRGVFQNAFGGVGPAIDVNSPQTNYNINPVALALLQLKLSNGQYVVPTPQTINTSNPIFDAQGSSAFSVACPYTEDQFVTNGDYQLSKKDIFSGRFFFANTYTVYELPFANLGGGVAPGFPVDLTNNFRNFTLMYTHIFSPALINQVEIGFHRTFSLFDQSKVFSYSQLGATVPPPDNTIPAIVIDFPSPSGVSLGGNGQTVRAGQNTYSVQDSLSWSRGRHSLRFGGGIARAQDNQVGFHYLAGEAFLSWPDFLLGLSGPQNGTGAFSNIFASLDALGLFDRAYRVLDGNAYVQDDIKVTTRFTLNLGFRYDRIGDFADALGRNASFNVGLANPNPPPTGTFAGTTVPANFSGGTIPAGVTKMNNNYGINGDGQNTWNPRVGFAYRLPSNRWTQDRVVIRGGYGVFHSRSTGQPFFQLLSAPPFGQIREFIGPSNATATEAVPLPLNIPSFPAFIPYSQNSQNFISVFAPNFRPPILQQYSLGFEAKLSDSMDLDVGYSGSRGLHLIRERSVNEADLVSPTNPGRGGITTNTLANIPQRVPFEGWTASGLVQIESGGASWYNALLVSLNKRFSHGLRFQASYTFARDLTTDNETSTGPNGGTAVGDQNNPASRYGPDEFIREHRFIINYSYDFPRLNSSHAFVRQALDGWTVAGVTTVQSGQRLSALYTNGANIYGITNDRASLSGTCTPGQYVNPGSVSSNIGGSKTYINTKCFTTPAAINPLPPAGDGATGFGNSPVGLITGPGQLNFDFSLLKHFPVHWPRDTANLEFRSEFFNAFNHPQFGNPDNTFGSPTFGQITTTVVAPRVIQLALKLTF